VEFSVLAGGAVHGDVPPEAVPALIAELPLEPPYAVRAVRRGPLAWAVAGRALRSEPVALALPDEISALEVVVAPAGDETVLVDGQEALAVEAAWQPAVEELRRRGRERFQSFVARADRVGEDRWELTVDPL
jgi:hypothetical protein